MTDRRAHLLRLSGALHFGAAALAVARAEMWPLSVGLVAANHSVLAAASVMPRSALLGQNLRNLADDPKWRSRVALTFDDGPDPEVTPQVVSILADRGCSASFFCVGRRVRENPEVARLLRENGHGVENHTDTHDPAFAFRGPQAAGREIERASEAIAEATGRPPSYFRPPAGMRNPWLAPVIAARGLQLVSWTRRGYDAVARNPEVIVRRLANGLAAGDILLLHDGFGPRFADCRPVVIETLPRLLDLLQSAGLQASRLPDPKPPV